MDLQREMPSVPSHAIKWYSAPDQSPLSSTLTVPLPTSLDAVFMTPMLNNPSTLTSTTTDVTTVIDVSTTTNSVSPSGSQTTQTPTATQTEPEPSLNTPSGKAALILGILLLAFIVVAVPLFFRSRDKWKQKYNTIFLQQLQHREPVTYQRGDVELSHLN